MQKYLDKIKKFFSHNYYYFIIIIALIYGGYLVYYIQKDVYDVYKSESFLLEKQPKILNIEKYNKIVEQKEIKQSPDYIENINNPFISD